MRTATGGQGESQVIIFGPYKPEVDRDIKIQGWLGSILIGQFHFFPPFTSQIMSTVRQSFAREEGGKIERGWMKKILPGDRVTVGTFVCFHFLNLWKTIPSGLEVISKRMGVD